MWSVRSVKTSLQGERSTRVKWGIFWGVMALATFAVAWFFPLTSDDYYYVFGYGHRFVSENGLLASIPWQYRTLNGRILGNFMGVALSPHRLLSSLVLAVMVFGVAMLCSRYLTRWSLGGCAFAFLLVFALPREMFREVYAWRAGFFNYVPGICLLLAYFALIGALFAGKRIKDTVGRVLACLILGIAVQLFVENLTVAVVLMAITVAVWHFLQNQKTVSWSTVAFTAGALAGALLMFSSPRYTAIADGNDSYRDFSFSLSHIQKNYALISEYGISQNTLLLVLTGILGLVLVYQHQRRDAARFRRLRVFNSLCFGVVPVYFLAMNSILAPGGFSIAHSRKAWLCDMVMVALLAAALLSTACFLVESRRERSQILFFTVFAAVLAGPLLVIDPVSPRCLYFTYIFWAVAVLSMTAAVCRQGGIELSVLHIPLVCLAAFVLGIHGYVYVKNMDAAQLRDAYIEQRMEAGDTTIQIPQYPYYDWVHNPQTGLNFRYYYKEESDIQFEILDYNKWLSSTAGHP